MQISEQEWSLLKWAGATLTTSLLFLSKFVFGHVFKTQEIQNERLNKIELTLAKISTKLEIEDAE